MSRTFSQILGALEPLSPDDLAALEGLTGRSRRVAAGETIVSAGGSSGLCHILVAGQAFRFRWLDANRRQILGFHMRGDLLDLAGLTGGLDYSVAALNTCEVMRLPQAELNDLTVRHPAIARALWKLAMVEAATLRAWLTGLGRRTAEARAAHLFCELSMRLRAAGLTNGQACPFPATQTQIADALGLSDVHTNRVLQALKSRGLLSYRRGEFVVLDVAGLRALAEFDPAYLGGLVA